MTDFLPWTPEEYQPDAPATALHFRRWFENWVAGFEGAPGAPKLRQINKASGAAAATQTFIGLDDFSGVEFDLAATVPASLATLSFAFSSDGGATWPGSATLATNRTVNTGLFLAGAFDFASGRLSVIGTYSNGELARVDTTISGAGLAINAVRFSGVQLVAKVKPMGATI